MFTEDDLLPLSGLQHMLYCERRWALIHLEGQWEENRFTAEGRVLHKRADKGAREVRRDVIVTRGVRLHSFRLGLVGQADVVEWRRVGQGLPPPGTAIPLEAREGSWQPMPVEYKRGRSKPNRWYEVQLCAQALCLEEMLGLSISEGALYYGASRRRSQVQLDARLRTETEVLAIRMHVLFQEGRTPVAKLEPKCRSCSLFERCQPDATSRRTVARYLDREVFTPEA